MLVTLTFDSYPNDFAPSPGLKCLFDKGGEVARAAIDDSELFIPMLIADTDAGFQMLTIDAMTLDELQRRAATELANQMDALRYLLIFEAEIETGEQRMRTIVIEGSEPTMAIGYRLCCISSSDPCVYHGHSKQLFG